MALKNYSSSDKEISVSGVVNNKGTSGLLKGMSKDVKKRWMFVGLAVIATLVMLSSWLSAGSSRKPAQVASGGRPVVETTPKGINDHKDWRAQTGAEISTLRKELQASLKAQKDLHTSLAQMQEELHTVKQTARAAAVAQASKPEPKKPESSRILLPDPPAPPPSLRTPAQPVVSAPPAPIAQAPSPPTNQAQPVVPVTPKRAPARAFLPDGSYAMASQQADPTYQEYEKNDKAGFLPAGSYAKATMISGVEAFTGGTAQSQPQPIVLRIDADAVLPNSSKYRIRGCHVLASVWGDMSSERVFGRLATLTCVNTENKLVLSQEVEGTLVDSDGKNGIRGVLIDRQGAKLARSLLAGLAEGMSDALGAAQKTSLATGAGLTTAVTGNSLASAGYGGASKAADQLSEFYLKQAEATMPVIAVDAGRRASVLFTKSLPLKFDTVDLYRPKEQQSVTLIQR